MSDQLEVLQGERCKHLLSKGLYINQGLKKGQEAAGDGNFWCMLTQTIFGPDDALCDGTECTNSGRSCYEAPGA